MESISISVIIILSISLFVLIIYHIYYRINIIHITKQLDEIINTKDTNQLLTIVSKQKDIIRLVNVLNRSVIDTRKSRIHIKKLNKHFRESIINISHDLRTPLTTAGGYVQILQSSNVTDNEREEYLSIILERQNMVKKLLEQLFEYVRIESGEITYNHIQIDAKEIFINTLALYYDDFSKIKQEPVIQLIDKPCIILGDEEGLKRIFSNVIFNSIVHGKGDYCFEIQESDSYTFTFSNKSDPMTNDNIDCIFERFYTNDQSRNRKTTGLGLSIAKEITKQFDGRIEAYYNDNRFSISILFPKIKED